MSRESTSSPGGLGGALIDMARKIRELQNEVEQLKRVQGGPGPDIIWVVDGTTVLARRISTGATAVAAGPL